MAFPVIEASNESNLVTAGTSHVVTLPAGVVSGDLILIVANKGNVNTSMNALAGWTELVSDLVANGNVIWYRKADGTEGSTVTFTSAAAVRSAHVSYRISGAADPAVQPPEISTVATGTSVNPNATTCTPTGGAKDYLWITMFGMAGEQADDDTLVTTFPTGYTDHPEEKTCGTAGTNLGGMVAAVARNNNAASEDAGAFTAIDNAAWRAYTIAIHPGPASFTGTGTPTQADDTSTATGWIEITGTSTQTQEDQTSTASGVLGYSGQVGLATDIIDGGATSTPPTDIYDGGATATPPTDFVDPLVHNNEDQTATATGWIEITGTVAVTQEAQTSSASGEVTAGGEITGTAAVTQEDQTSTATGVLGYTGTAAVTQADDTSTATGVLGYSGTAAVTQDDQTSTASGVLGYTGTAAITQEDQTCSASGSFTGIGEITGSAAVTQPDQTSIATGQLGSSGTAAVTQADQTAAASGWITVTGMVAATQDDQTGSATGQLGYAGTAAATQDNQVATASGWITITGTAAVTQADQVSTATGFVGEIPRPSGHPLYVKSGRNRLRVPQGTHLVEVE